MQRKFSYITANLKKNINLVVMSNTWRETIQIYIELNAKKI